MKAIRVHQFGGPDVLKLESVQEPKPASNQVLVQVKAIGVNPVDTYVREGKYGERSFPYTPGTDAAGIIVAVGPEAGRVRKNDRVYVAGSVSGTYAEIAICKESQVHPLPAHLSFEQGAAIGVPYATAYLALFHRANAQAGETVFVHGASGGVGIAAIQLARSRGLTVIGTGGTPQGRELVANEGAHHVLDHRAIDYLEQLQKLTGGSGVQIILEMLANVNLGNDLKLLSNHGRVIVIGSRGEVQIDPRDTMSRNADIRGMSLTTMTEQERAEVHAALVDALAKGSLRPVIGQKFTLAEAFRAHEAIMQPGHNGKIVLVP